MTPPGEPGPTLRRRLAAHLASTRVRRAGLMLALGLLGLAVLVGTARHAGTPPMPTRLALVVADGTADDDVMVLAWRDTAAEAGFPLEVMSASQLLRDGTDAASTALILPDTMHRQMNDALLAHVARRVDEGALLMLVHDAGVADLTGRYHPQQSRWSQLAGVRYALYGDLKGDMLRGQEVWMDARALPLLRLPPGKLVREGSDRPLTSAQAAPQADEELAVASYIYGRLRYPVFATTGTFDGTRLMHGDRDSVVAGVRSQGRGQVLFVNMPLTYLKLRTDSLFMYSFLRYFAQDLAMLPQLSPMPDARGAVVMNWHIDSAAAVPAMQRLEQLGAFATGPYSIHLTVGPDVDVPGDGKGMDLAHNAVMRDWVRRFSERGDEIGSHGGWIHNEFGRVIGTQDPKVSTELIERNTRVIRETGGKPVREYSAPTGNHPAWVTPWLRERGFRSYYFTGDIGMPPTRSYQDGQRGPSDMWAFPVLSYGSYAAFEEAHAHDVTDGDMAAWLKDVSDYCATNRTVRLVYFHPPGLAYYPDAFREWLAHTRDLIEDKLLRFTTMAAQTDFANRRLQVQWSLQPEGRRMVLRADHPGSMAHMAWLLPVSRYAEPRVREGRAAVARDGAYWRITAEGVPHLAVDTELLAETALPSAAAAMLSPQQMTPQKTPQ